MRSDLRLKALWACGGWAMIIVVVTLCMLPAPTIAPVAGFLPDKAEHAISFFGLTAWFCGLYLRPSWWKVALGMILLGGAIEIAQGLFTTTRAMELNDWIADGIGVAVALAISAVGVGHWMRFIETRVLRLDPGR